MELPTVRCPSLDLATRIALDGETAAFPVTTDDDFLAADAVCDITLHYARPTASVLVSIPDANISIRRAANPPAHTFKLSPWTATTPYMGHRVLVCDPQPSSITAQGIVYPPAVRYRLLSHPHSFEMDGLGIVTYGPGDKIQFIPACSPAATAEKAAVAQESGKFQSLDPAASTCPG